MVPKSSQNLSQIDFRGGLEATLEQPVCRSCPSTSFLLILVNFGTPFGDQFGVISGILLIVFLLIFWHLFFHKIIDKSSKKVKYFRNLLKIWPWVDFLWFSVHRVFERPYSVFALFHWFALLQTARKTYFRKHFSVLFENPILAWLRDDKFMICIFVVVSIGNVF